jgi:hypothetical protein
MSFGLAKTNAFMLGTASVLIGAQADLFDLNPADHSIGLVKNFSMSAEPGYVELTQGVKNTVVFSVLNANPVRASMEVFEFTGQNIANGLGLDGSLQTAQTDASTIGTQVVGDNTVVAIPVASGASFAQDDYIMIPYGTADEDKYLVRKVASISMNTLTVDKPIPTGITLAVGKAVKVVSMIGVGSKTEQPFLSAQVVGTLADGKEIAILIPKLRITKGFTMAFQSDNYGNLPYEFTVYDLVATDPHFADFAGDQARIFTRS